MRLVFRELKNNWYSIAVIVSAIHSRRKDVELHVTKSVDDILKFPPKETVVAYSFMSFDLHIVKEEVDLLKSRGYILIAGGPHPTADPEGTLSMGFDYVFTGDGENNILKFLEGERPSNRIFDGLKERVDLNDFPPFSPELGIFIPIEITRGCPFRCAYCQTPQLAGKMARHRSIEMIVHYASEGVKRNKKVARFISPNSFGYGSRNGIKPDPDVVEKLLFELKKVGVEEIYFGTFPSDVRPESVSDDILRRIKKYVNNRSIVIGAQSGSDRILRIIKRGHTVEMVEKAIETIANNGFIPHVDFIFGFPFEKEEDVLETFKFIEKIVKKYKARIHAHTFMPLPGTELFKVGPGKLTKQHYKFLGSLASKGLLDGYWHKQQELSRRVYENAGSGRPDLSKGRRV